MNFTSSMTLFFCFSAIFTMHGMEQQGKGKEKDKDKKKTSTQQSSTHLSFPWKQNEKGVWEYNSGSTQYYESSINNQQLAQFIAATSTVSTR